MHIATDWKIGPAFVVLVVQTLGAATFGGIIYNQLASGVVNTKNTVEKLETLIVKQAETQVRLDGRLIRVETLMDTQSQSILQIDRKLDALKK